LDEIAERALEEERATFKDWEVRRFKHEFG
jgi:hypothetical protein